MGDDSHDPPAPFIPESARSLKELDNDHLPAVKLAMFNVLSTELAIDTFAQVADGIPAPHPDDDGIVKIPAGFFGTEVQNVGLSQKAREFVIEMRDDLDLESIDIDEKAVNLFSHQDPIDRRGFTIALLEVVARLCHHLAASLFELTEGGFRKHEVADIARTSRYLPRMEYPPYRTTVFHPCYDIPELFPRGAADVAGYWAEATLFGGVVLFDRGLAQTNNCHDTFLDSLGSEPGIFRVSEDQLRTLADFFMSTGSDTPLHCLPIRMTKFSRRYYAGEAIGAQIYRSKYDRESTKGRMPESDVVVSSYVRGTDPVRDALDVESERREVEQLERLAREGWSNPFPPPLSPAPEEEPYIEKC